MNAQRILPRRDPDRRTGRSPSPGVIWVSALVWIVLLGLFSDARPAGAGAAPSAPGTITAVAGTGVAGFSGDGGPATSAQLNQPRAIAFDRSGNRYVVDTVNQRIRKIDPSGIITTIAGTGVAGYSGDGGPATAAEINWPHGAAIDSAGNLYISDSSNHRIRKIDRAGIITTVAGTGVLGFNGDGPGPSVELNQPKALFMDANDTLYFDDQDNNRVRRLDASGVVTTVAGDGVAGYGGDGGPATSAHLQQPKGVWVDGHGSVYIADFNNNRVRRVDPAGIITTLAGTGAAGFNGDGIPATSAELWGPRAVAVDAGGNLYIGEELNQRVRRVDSGGVITTVAGTGVAGSGGDGGPATQAQLSHLRGLNFDPAGNLYIADCFNHRIREVILAPSASTPPTPAPPAPSPPATTVAPLPPPSAPPARPGAGRAGYWMVAADGKAYNFGDAADLGDASGALPSGVKAVDLEPTPSGNGYWIVDNLGSVHSFGDAHDLGNVNPSHLLAGEQVTSLSATPSGAGYWIFTSRGRVLNFGDAAFFGDMSRVVLNGPVLGSVPTATGKGYWMVAADGGIFSFGDADFHGSMGGRRLNAPVQSLVPTADGAGYWLVASDGGVFAFGAPFRGSMGGTRLSKPITGMVPYGDGYLMVGEDGGVFDFSNLAFVGSLGANPPAHPIVAVAAAP
jgi:hypothetical protein